MNYHVGNDLRGAIEADRAHVWHHLSQHKRYETDDPLMIIEGKGLRIWNQEGVEHLDCVSGGVWTVNVGYGRERIANAVRDAILKMNFFGGTAGTVPGALFAERLLGKMPGMSRVYYSNSGSEANEKGYKIIRQIAHQRYGGKKHKILYRERDYHGTTITALSSGGHEERRAQYGPYTPGFVPVPHCLEYRSQYDEGADYTAESLRAIEGVIEREGADTIGGIVLEPIVAGGGAIVPPTGYLEGVRALCDKHDMLLMIDEVVCGMGRTGTWFGYQHTDVVPDIVTMAKGVASGYAAISCTVTTEAVFDQFKRTPGDHMSYFRDISTFGGCTAGPAAAMVNMDILEEEDLLANSTSMGEYLKDEMRALADRHEIIGDVRGEGLFVGVELVTDRDTKEPTPEGFVQKVQADCMNHAKVVIGGANRSLPGLNNVLLFAPPLIATRSDIDEVVEAVDAALGRVSPA